MVNKVIIEGRLMKSVEVKTLPSGKEMARITLVHTQKYQDKNKQWKERVYFFDVDVFSQKLIEKAKRFQKGDRILIEGEIRQERWIKNNKKQSKIKIKANRLQLISKSKTATVSVKTEKVAS
jgi:single-strand DNA-binding protein